MTRLILFSLSFLISTSILSQDYEELWDLYSSGDYDLVIDVGESLLEIDPEGVELNLLLGRAYADNNEPGQAIPFLKTAIRSSNSNSSNNAWAGNYLGKCYFAIGEYDAARNALEKCVALNATKNVTSSSKSWLRTFGFHPFFEDWDVIESTHFVFHFSPDTHVEDKMEYVEIRERAFKQINSFFTASLPKKIDFFVWNSNKEGANVGLDQIGFAKPNFCLLHSRYNQTIGHEMTHIISNYITNNLQKTTFINEGTAVSFDLEQNNKMVISKNALNGQLISIKQLWEDWSILSTEISYPLAGAFVSRLIEWGGREKFLEFFKDQSLDNAWSVYGIELDDFITSFEDEF